MATTPDETATFKEKKKNMDIRDYIFILEEGLKGSPGQQAIVEIEWDEMNQLSAVQNHAMDLGLPSLNPQLVARLESLLDDVSLTEDFTPSEQYRQQVAEAYCESPENWISNYLINER